MNPAYRSDIDGLRAIAVLLVVGFHAFPHQIPGGFVGVDIFFVISGFLITGIISNALAHGQFSFADFYLRRAKRLFPALLTVLVACMVFGWLVLLPPDYRNLGRDIGAGAGFIANLVLLQTAGYFDTASELKPLLHLWSLGVEEQFYLVWPLTIAIAWRWRHGPIATTIVVLLVSFAWNVALVRSNPPAAFYLPVTRFWELMVGCALALLTQKRNDRDQLAHVQNRYAARFCDEPTMRGIATWAGALLIVAATLLIDPRRSFPGWWALLPTGGAALLVFAGGTTLINRCLSHPALVSIGLISYPLYLWHWPVLSYLRILRFSEPTVLMKLIAICLAFALAHLTYKFIEKPIRFGKHSAFRPIMTSVGLGLTGVLGLLIFAQQGIPARFPAGIQTLTRDFRREARLNEGDTCFTRNLLNAPVQTGAGQRRIVLWGDSHAQHLVPGMCQLARQHDFQLILSDTGGCPPIFLFNNEMAPKCSATNEAVARATASLKPDILILAAFWYLYQGNTLWGRIPDGSLEMTIKQLKKMGIERIVVVGQLPVWFASPARILARFHRSFGNLPFMGSPASVPDRTPHYLRPSFADTDRTIGAIAAKTGIGFVSPLATFCNGDGCLLVVPDSGGEPTMFDTNHLTRAGSSYFATSNERALLSPFARK